MQQGNVMNHDKILLIEDDLDDAELTIHALSKRNFANHVIHIDDGAAAIKYLFDENNTRPGLILLDLRMPRVDGIQILRRLKSDAVKSAIPVIVLISSKGGQHYVESFNLKADGYLQKPIDCEQFLETVRRLGLGWVGGDARVEK